MPKRILQNESLCNFILGVSMMTTTSRLVLKQAREQGGNNAVDIHKEDSISAGSSISKRHLVKIQVGHEDYRLDLLSSLRKVLALLTLPSLEEGKC